MNKKTGFTMMELLVIIVIIGFLAGMIFPTLGKARIRARKAKVISELKTIELALMDYYVEYSGFPTNKDMTPPGTNGLDKLVAEEYLDITPKDPFVGDEIYQYYSSNDGGDLADSCIIFSVGPDNNDVTIVDFTGADNDAYPPGQTEPTSDNIYLIVPLEDFRYKK